MTGRPDWAVFVAMVREEWRLHARLFGGGRFAAFPLFVALVGAGAVWALRFAATALAGVIFGFHLLVFAFGLYTGTVGLVGSDAMRNLLGDVTLVLFSARTLPLSRRRLLGIFLVKDAVYYAALFLVPSTVAFAPVAVVDGWASRLPALWLTATATFLLGLSTTFLAIGLSTHGRRGRIALLVGVVATAVAGVSGVNVAAYLPYSLYAAGDVRGFVGVVAVPVLSVAGVTVYDPTYERPVRTAGDTFASWNAHLGDPLLTKTLLDVSRSGGGVWKVFFSGGILFVVSAYLLRVAESITGLRPSTGLAFGAILGLTGFTTYNWLTQFDDTGFYLSHPVSIPDVFRAKFRAFLLLGFPTAFVYFAIAVVAFGARLADVVAGIAVLTGLSVYLFGLVVYLAGFSPNEFLFDTVLFSAFTVAIAVPLVPVLVVGFVAGTLSPSALAAVVVGSALFGALGLALYHRSLPRWDRAYRRELG